MEKTELKFSSPSMGATPSKEELLYQEVQNGNHDAVKSLHRDGASLEWIDREGRTPLLLACSRGELLDMTITLLNMGANMKAYCSGTRGGYPLHFAAKRGLDKTVTLLLSHGANPLAVNDNGHTPLEMARSRGHVAVVRLLEEQLCIFSGTLRELSGLGILESLAPNLVTKKVWAVVLPLKSHSRRAPEYELAIYEPPKLSLWNGVRASSTHPAGLCNVAQPRSVITLAMAEMEEPDFTLPDPMICIVDKVHKTKYKMFSESRGDKEQLKSLYRACRAVSQVSSGRALANDCDPCLREDNDGPPSQPVLQSMPASSSGRFSDTTSNMSMTECMSEELAFELTLNESIRTANVEGITVSVSPDASSEFCPWMYQEHAFLDDHACSKERGHQKPNSQFKRTRTRANAYKATSSAPQRWTSTRFLSKDLKEVFDGGLSDAAFPSAPPLLPYHTSDDTHTKSAGTCVVCCDASAEGACIPCGHLAGCMNCLTRVKSMGWGCPVCRRVIEQVMKVYAV